MLLLTLFAFFCVTGTASRAEGKPTKKEEASERFQKGVELYSNGNMRAALIEFRRAYKLVPTYQLLYNLGQVAAELNDYVEAYNYYKLYLRKAKGKIDDERRSEVEEQMERLEGFLAFIKFRVSEDDAEVLIDGMVVGESPMYEAIRVGAGRHKVVVTLEGFARYERTVDVAGRDKKKLRVELISLSVDPDEDVANPFLEAEPGTTNSATYSRAFWTSAAVTGLLAAGTGFAAIQTLRARNVYREQLVTPGNSAENIQLASDNMKQLALMADIGMGLTLVGVVSTFFLARHSDSQHSAGGRQSSGRGLRMQVSPNRVALSGEF